jgi:hypothetical protein
VRLDAIGAGGFDQRVQSGARGGASGGLTEQPIPPSDAAANSIKAGDGPLFPSNFPWQASHG